MMEQLLVVGAAYNLAFAILHLGFWRLFDWKKELVSLTPVNRAVIQILNLSLITGFLIFAYISFFHGADLLATDLGRSLLLLISIFWALRAVEQIVFFGVKHPLSVVFFVAFCFGAVLYAYLWYQGR